VRFRPKKIRLSKKVRIEPAPGYAERITRGLGDAIRAAQSGIQSKIPTQVCPACGDVMLRNPKARLWICTRFKCRYAMTDEGATAYLSHWPAAPFGLSCGKSHARG